MFKNDKRFMGPLYAFVFNDWLTWVWCLYIVSGTQPWFLPEDYWLFRSYIPQTVGGWALFTFVWGYMAGVNGLAGHELIHKREVGHKILGTYTYSKIMYSHFFYEHNSGHHRNVATPDDPATARKGEPFWTFAVRSAIGGHVNTWNREVNRIQVSYEDYKNIEKQRTGRLILENRMVHFFILHLGIVGGIGLIFGKAAVMFQLGYSFVGIFFIELINYTEHYGLNRVKDARGIYEPITQEHSWNSTSSHLLFRIQRHSDHHMHWYKPY